MDGPFQDIELLKSRPAHMAVFMRYVFTQLLDPNPLVSSHYILGFLPPFSEPLFLPLNFGVNPDVAGCNQRISYLPDSHFQFLY